MLDYETSSSIRGMDRGDGIPIGTALSSRIDPIVTVKGRTPRKSRKSGPQATNMDDQSVAAPLDHIGYTAHVADQFDESEAALDALAEKYGY